MLKIKTTNITSAAQLNEIDASPLRRALACSEYFPLARGIGWEELATNIFPARSGIVSFLLVGVLYAPPETGLSYLSAAVLDFLRKRETVEPLSLTAGVSGDMLCILFFIRAYESSFSELNAFLSSGLSSIPLSSAISETEREKEAEKENEANKEEIRKQAEIIRSVPHDVPLLNALESYQPMIPGESDCVYMSPSVFDGLNTQLPHEAFRECCRETVRYLSTVEKDLYFSVLRGQLPRQELLDTAGQFIARTLIPSRKLPEEDAPALMDTVMLLLLRMGAIEPLLNDSLITDIKMTACDRIRVRVKGKTYRSNLHFGSPSDYELFLSALAVKCGIDLDAPVKRFSDISRSDYVLRFSYTAAYVTGTGLPCLHIRKIPRKKLMSEDLIRLGMMDEKVRNYLLDCGKTSRGVVFAGPPGSGKTCLLNWFLEEAYEPAAEILCIQESEELFSDRPGILFEHTVSAPGRGEQAITLEQLGQHALVAGANVFIIGEVKGAEICSAITLSNSGCRTAMTLHSPSARETIDKMTDLALRGFQGSYGQTKRMLKSFQTIVYLRDFQVCEITEITGFNEKMLDMEYREIYRKET